VADLSNILGGPWSPPARRNVEPPEVQLADAMRESGLSPPAQIIMDGKIHRFSSDGKAKGDTGWLVAFANDGAATACFGCWKSGIKQEWRADIGRDLSDAEKMTQARRMREARDIRDRELERNRAVAADTVATIWERSMPASPDHPYLARKGVQPNGARVTGDGRLMVPLYKPDGELASLQYIAHDGGKLYHAGGMTGGCFWMVGDMSPGVLYVAEGFATAATIHEATGRPCVLAYSASNLVPVVGALREQYGPSQPLTIVADNDESGTGQKYADQASAKYGCSVITPPERGDANDYAQAGGDLALLLNPPQDDWLVPADDFCAQPQPIRWLVKRWLQDEALIMVHGPSGGGKTFVVLDWCLHIASAKPDWNGHKVKPGGVIYLAGEGHSGLRGRVAAWKAHHGAERLNMWLSRAGCDLNTPEGYRRVSESIRALGELPRLIVVDTLHRFLQGDENSAQDAKTMIDACGALMREFGCSVLLVHHTGVSDEAQHRARGSSAWRGALEIEISVTPVGDLRKIAQKKMKDGEEAEDIFVELQNVPLAGWVDEDGEQVSSAVPVMAEAPVERKKDDKLATWKKTFSAAWFASGAEEAMGEPYLSKSALVRYLVTAMGESEATAKQTIKPSVPNRLIGALLASEMIIASDHGWRVICPSFSSSLMMAKNAPR